VWLGLAALLGATFLGNVDVAIANVAGPSIRSGLHATGGQLELVVSGYTLAFAVLLVTCARLGQARRWRLAALGRDASRHDRRHGLVPALAVSLEHLSQGPVRRSPAGGRHGR
jgi:MFS family permease